MFPFRIILLRASQQQLQQLRVERERQEDGEEKSALTKEKERKKVRRGGDKRGSLVLVLI